jgi:hexosaminidase
MPKLAVRCLALFLFCFSIFSRGFAVSPAEDRPVLLPLPLDFQWQEGFFPVSAYLNLTFHGNPDSQVKDATQRFLKRLEKRTGLQLEPNAGAKTESLVIDCKAKGLPVQSVREDESYSLTVTPTQVLLSAPHPLGILRGLETLLQLVQPKGKDSVIPCVTLHDKPRFPWRGLMIDACRHWMPLEVILRNLDGMAEAKLNVFHWHLSENQGFRVESLKFPKLQEMGSDGHYYTQDQIKAVVAYARARGIRVVPEFDMPGHSTAWLVGYPELASAPGPYQIERKFGVFDPCLDPTKEEVYRFLDSFIGEMAALFPDEYFHIGGDEVNGKHWNENPDIQRFMVHHGLKTNEELQGYFNSRLEKILAKYHKKMVGWDEILRPGLPRNIVVQSWRGADALADSARQGFDGILSNGYYLDLAQPASVHYAMDPIPADSPLAPEQKAHILGGEACMWSELVTPENVDSRIWPRTLAVSERLWSPATARDVDDFYRRMEVESARLEELGLTHLSSYPEMLKRLAGDFPVGPLKMLADAVEPVKNYQRHRWGAYTSDFPLNRLADAARPESDLARHFKKGVEEYLKTAPAFGDARSLESQLKVWKDNGKALEPLLEKSDLLVDTLPQSQDLSASAQTGLEALAYLKSGKLAPSSWVEKANQTLDRAQEPKAQVEIAVIPAIRKLVLAAGQQDKLKGSSPEEWNKSLDAQVEAAKPKQ